MLTFEEYKAKYTQSSIDEGTYNMLMEISLEIFKYMNVDVLNQSDCVKNALGVQIYFLECNEDVLDGDNGKYKSVSITNFSATLIDNYDVINSMISPIAYMKLANCGEITSIANAGRSCCGCCHD